MQINEEKMIKTANLKEFRGISRREFIKATGFLIGSFAIGPTALLAGCGFPPAPQIDSDAYSVEKDKVIVKLDRVPELSRVGGAVAITYDNERICIVVAKTERDGYIVASNQCTHREKPLGYDNETKQLICASGKSKFRLDGSIVTGPAERPLQIYRWCLNQGNLVVDLLNESS